MADIRERKPGFIILVNGEKPPIEPFFNVDFDYGNEYASVYFRIDAPHYQFSTGFNSEPSEREIFHTELRTLFGSWEWKEAEFRSSCPTVHRNKESLYLHPQSFSGVILKNSIKEIYERINNADTFKLYAVDVYETYYDICDEVHLNALAQKKIQIRNDLLKAFVTKRKNLFYPINNLHSVVKNYLVNRVLSEDGKNGGYGITHSYIAGVFSELIDDHLIVVGSKGNQEIYRTINRQEQKQLKVNLDLAAV